MDSGNIDPSLFLSCDAQEMFEEIGSKDKGQRDNSAQVNCLGYCEGKKVPSIIGCHSESVGVPCAFLYWGVQRNRTSKMHTSVFM